MADSTNDGSDTPSAPTSTPPETTPTTNPKKWKSLAPMNTERDSAGGICVNDHQFLVMGGQDGSKSLSSCEYYDKNTDTWTNLSVDLPYRCTAGGVASVGDRVFVMGGYVGSMNSKEYRFDLHSIHVPGGDLSTLAGGNWETLAPMKQARQGFACVSDSRYIYVFGGNSPSPDDIFGSDTAERYDTETKKWEPLPPMPDKRNDCAAGMVGNKIYVVGGHNFESGVLASTIVFDTSKRQWESSTATSDAKDGNNPASASAPAVPNMKTRRSRLSVVVMDRFVIAMGGWDGSNNRLSSIEVLDTERNGWNDARVPMKDARHSFMAWVWKGTDEIVVAGGWGDGGKKLNTAESISFQSGILPPGFRFRERGQTIMGDTEQGKDQLGLAIIAIALVEMILFLDLVPPFVLGIFGQWGKGKSFFFNLMLDAMIKIQKTEVDDGIRRTYPGHIYVVKFNSWTFAKGCIWSSMMYQILKTLNEYLQFEENVGNEVLRKGKVSTIQVFRDLMKNEREYLGEHKEILENIKQDGDRASHRLLEAINSSYEEDKTKLEEIEKEINQEQASIHREQALINQKRHQERIHKQERQAIKKIKEILYPKGEAILKDALENAKTRRENNRSGDSEENNGSGDSEENNGSGDSEEDAIVSDLIEAMKGVHFFYYRFRISNIPSFAFICTAALLILAIVLLQTYPDKIGGILSALLSLIIPVITSFSSAMKQIQPIVEELDKQIQPIIEELNGKVNTKEDLEVGNVENDKLKKMYTKKAELEKTKAVLEKQIFALEGESLQDIVADKFDRNMYEDNLGIVHKVQQDLQVISDAMLNPKQKGIFPRGEPRIVLFVDDLDRVEKNIVVEVVEALQLLVKTKLFVAAVAIDPRYVTLSIENHYEGVLDPQTPPSGMDFLEKIIQVPFRLPGVERGCVDAFVESQIEKEVVKRDSQENDDTVGIEPVENTASADSNTPESQQEEKIVSAESSANVIQEDKAFPRDKVYFSSQEVAMMKDIFKLFGVGPRCMKRIINVFKVLQVIWKRGKGQFPDDLELKRATLFLMLMASDESTRDITYQIFDWMDKGRVKYHYVAPDSNGKNDLSKLFKQELRKWDKDFEFSFSKFSFSGEATKKGTLMDSIEDYLSEYTWEDINGWNKVSSKFFLARSFSFFRLATDEIEMKQNQLTSQQDQRRISN